MTEAFCKKYPELCVKDYFTDTFLKIPQYGKKAKVPTEKKVRVDDDRVEPPEPVPESGIKVPQRTFDDILIPERRKGNIYLFFIFRAYVPVRTSNANANLKI